MGAQNESYPNTLFSRFGGRTLGVSLDCALRRSSYPHAEGEVREIYSPPLHIVALVKVVLL